MKVSIATHWQIILIVNKYFENLPRLTKKIPSKQTESFARKVQRVSVTIIYFFIFFSFFSYLDYIHMFTWFIWFITHMFTWFITRNTSTNSNIWWPHSFSFSPKWQSSIKSSWASDWFNRFSFCRLSFLQQSLNQKSKQLSYQSLLDRRHYGSYVELCVNRDTGKLLYYLETIHLNQLCFF